MGIQTGEKVQSNQEKLMEAGFFLLVAMYVAYYFLMNTTFPTDVLADKVEKLRILAFLFVFVRAVYGEKNHKETLLCLVAGGIFLLTEQVNYQVVLIDLTLLLMAGRGVELKRIARVYLVTVGTLLVVTMGMALTGHITNYVLTQVGHRTRIAFGVAYPTDFSAYVFYLVLAWAYIRGKAIMYVELVAMAAVSAFIYLYCDARTGTGCILLVIIALLWLKLGSRHAEHRGKQYQMNGVLAGILATAPVIAATGMLVLTACYSPDSKLMLMLDDVLNNRLRLGKKGLELYGLSLRGQVIDMIGSGNRAHTPANYFYLDSSYINIALQYGTLVLGVVLLLFLVLGYRARNAGDYTLLWILGILSLHCMIEHHMLEIGYNFLLVGAVCKLGITNQAEGGQT